QEFYTLSTSTYKIKKNIFLLGTKNMMASEIPHRIAIANEHANISINWHTATNARSRKYETFTSPVLSVSTVIVPILLLLSSSFSSVFERSFMFLVFFFFRVESVVFVCIIEEYVLQQFAQSII